MKKLITLTLGLIVISSYVYAQDNNATKSTQGKQKSTNSINDTNIGKSFYFINENDSIYKFPKGTVHTKHDVENVIKNNKRQIFSKRYQKFTILENSADPDYYIIYVWYYPNPDSTTEKHLSLTITQQEYSTLFYGVSLPRETSQSIKKIPQDSLNYLLKKTDLTDNCKEIKGRYAGCSFGTMIFPFTWRSGGVFQESFNIGIIFGPSWSIGSGSDWHFGGYIGASATSNTLDSATSRGGIEKKSITLTTFSPSLSAILSYKTFQITVGFGMDFLVGDRSTATQSWIYRQKPFWLGLGMGVNIFNTNSSTPSSSQPQKDKNKN